MRKNIPVKDGDFNEKQEVITTHVDEHLQTFGINATWFAEVLEARAEWRRTYALCRDPATRTKPATAAKRRARTAYELLLSQLISMLKTLPGVTPDHLVVMQLVVNRGGRQSPLPPPPNAPGIQVDTSTSNRLKVKAYNAHELERGRPRGAVAYLLFWTLSRKEPVHLSGYTNTTYSSEPTVTLDFEFDQSGATVILCACWINVKGERSPLSKAVRVVVP